MSAESGYEQLLKEIPADWDDVPIAQLGKVVSGSTPSRDVPGYWGGKIPWVTPGELTGLNSRQISQTNESITPQGLNGSGANLLPEGSLLITTRATLGARAINSVPMATNQGFKSIVFTNPVDTDYYYYWTEKLVPELRRRASGTTFLEISGSQFSQIRVPSPPEHERVKIAQILDTLDTQIRQTEALIAKLEYIKQGLLTDLLTRGIDQSGQLRPTPEQAPHLYKDSPLGRIPRQWSVAPLGSLSEIVSGVTLGGTSPGLSARLVPYLRVANVQDGFLDLSEIKYIRVTTADAEKYRLKEGDVLMNEGGDYDKLGRGTVWRNEIADCIHQNHVFRVRPNANVLLSDYLAAYSASPGGKNYFLRASKQSTNLASINSTQLKAFPIPLAPLSEQRTIMSLLSGMGARIDSESLSLRKLLTKKSGLMDDLLTGRVRVTPLLDTAGQAHG